MIVVVNDANILIDLVKLELYAIFFDLPLVFYTTDIILEELHFEQKEHLTPFIEKGTFKILNLSPDDLIEINELQKEKPQLSIQDFSAVVCSKKVNGAIITSDNNLRKFASTKNIQVLGHLWVFDKMVESGKINPKIAIHKLVELNTKINIRLNLPTVECDIRINHWQED